ncbi:MAG TPA: hypothetical protein VKR58_14560 [Aquella sp.]|nr:hypothetical protein [Aquella sp.]
MSSNDYWTGPFGVRVFNTIKEVPLEDLCNAIYKDGSYSEVTWDYENVVSEDKYKSMFTTLGSDGYYYFDPTKCNFTIRYQDKKISVTLHKENKISNVMKCVVENFSLIPGTFVLTIDDTLLNDAQKSLEEYGINRATITVHVLSCQK